MLTTESKLMPFTNQRGFTSKDRASFHVAFIYEVNIMAVQSPRSSDEIIWRRCLHFSKRGTRYHINMTQDQMQWCDGDTLRHDYARQMQFQIIDLTGTHPRPANAWLLHFGAINQLPATTMWLPQAIVCVRNIEDMSAFPVWLNLSKIT